jgi:preprotein translocase subunit SecY
MNAKSVAEQIASIGMQIPGYRRDPRVIESVLNKYIPALAFLGGVTVGALAALADLLGAIGTGTGLLLSVMIIYNYYELIKNEDLEGMPEFVKKLFGG